MFYFISNTYTLEQSNTKRLSQGVLDESVQGGSSRRGGSSSSRRLSLGGRRRLLGFGGRGRQQLDLDGSSSSHQRRGGGFNLLGRLGRGSSGLIQPGVQFVHGVSGRWDCRGHRQVSSMTRSGRKDPRDGHRFEHVKHQIAYRTSQIKHDGAPGAGVVKSRGLIRLLKH